MLKVSHTVFILNIIAFISESIYFFTIGINLSILITLFVILLMTVTIFFTMEAVIKNEKFLLDSKELQLYNVENIKKLWKSIQIYFLSVSFIFNLLIFFSNFIPQSKSVRIFLLFAYILSILIYIIFINYKYNAIVLIAKNKTVQNNNLKSNIVLLSFIILILIAIFPLVKGVEVLSIYHISVVIAFLSLFNGVISYVKEIIRIQQILTEQKKEYHISKYFTISTVIIILSIINIFLSMLFIF